MLAVIEPVAGVATSTGTAPVGSPLIAEPAATAGHRLATGDVLFQVGDARDRLYRVQSGAICHYINWSDGRHEVIEFAFPGDIVGLGHLDYHVSSAQAMVETTLVPVSEEEFASALASDDQLSMRLAAAGDREFDVLRDRAVRSGLGQPAKRLASFLLAISHVNDREGRDGSLVTDELRSGVVADALNMSVDNLADLLKEMESKGLVAPAGDALLITDAAGLEKLADAA